MTTKKQDFINAILTGDLETPWQILEFGYRFDSDDSTVILPILKRGGSNTNLLINMAREIGWDLNTVMTNGMTPLYVAITDGNYTLAGNLLRHGARKITPVITKTNKLRKLDELETLLHIRTIMEEPEELDEARKPGIKKISVKRIRVKTGKPKRGKFRMFPAVAHLKEK